MVGEDLNFVQRLNKAASQWKERGRAPGLLWSRLNLDLLNDYHLCYGEEMTALQMDFFEASRKKRRRVKRIRQGLFASLTLLVLIALGFAKVAINQSVNEAEQRKMAVPQKISRSRELANYAMSALDTDPTLSFRRAEAAVNIEPTFLARKALGSTLAFPFHDILLRHTGSIKNAVFSPEGDRVLASSDDGAVWLWDASVSGHK